MNESYSVLHCGRICGEGRSRVVPCGARRNVLHFGQPARSPLYRGMGPHADAWGGNLRRVSAVYAVLDIWALDAWALLDILLHLDSAVLKFFCRGEATVPRNTRGTKDRTNLDSGCHIRSLIVRDCQAGLQDYTIARVWLPPPTPPL